MKIRVRAKTVYTYLLIFIFFICLTNCLKGKFFPLKFSLLVALAYNNFAIIPLYILYNLSSVFYFNFTNVLVDACMSSIIIFISFFYKKAGFKPNAELVLYLLACLVPYLIINSVSVEKAVYTAIIIVFSFICIVAVRLLFINGFKYKADLDELFSTAVFIFTFGLGLINFCGYGIWKAVCVFIILFTAYLFNDGTGTLVACVLSLPCCFALKSLNPLGVYALYSLLALTSVKYSRILSALLTLALELCLFFFTPLYASYSYFSLVAFIVCAFAFAFIPKKQITLLKENFFKFKEKKLPRQAINRARLILSDRLFEISGVFNESFHAMGNLKKLSLNEDDIKDRISSNVYNGVCKTCPLKTSCDVKEFPSPELFGKLSGIGIAKGKLTLMDLPTFFTENCSFSNNILYAFNNEITSYKDKLKISKAFNDERELLGLQASSVSSVLKELAINYSSQLSFSAETEKILSQKLHRNGILFSEIMYYKNGFNFQIDLVIEKSDYDGKKITKILSEALNKKVCPSVVVNLSQTYLAVTFTPAPTFDAIFGISQTCKNGNNVCGDTHSLTKIDEGRFMVAVNDGMGSGEIANSVSSLTMSLLESLMKTGLDQNFAINVLNKILTVSCPETFSALDLAVIDLFDGQAKFIKIGAPYGYILEKDNIKIVEASSLPLGIVDNYKAVSGNAKLKNGDTVILISDGVSDAFGSSTDLLEFLKSQTTLNPQTLADNILNRATFLDGQAKDDMTVLCVKVFNKSA